MDYGRWLRLLLAGTAFAALVATAGLPLPGADRLGLGGTAAAQAMDIDYFYDELGAYGEWVWHPRFGYVWLPGQVSENWRPYTVGHWVYTDEYGWYWDSYEPFAWAVYHYGRWGYDPDYGWFWVPGDTWAPAWVQWRYGDAYVGWAPIGPTRRGYSYGLPLSYDPPVAEAWVFVPPRYLTSRTLYRYALPADDLGVAFDDAPYAYRPEFRGGVVFNFGMPRDRAARYMKRPIIGQKIYRVDRKGGRYGKFEGGEKGIRVFAPGFEHGAKPSRKPKRFVDSPFEFKPKAKLKHTFKGKPPKGWGPGAAEVEPVAKEVGPQGFKPGGQGHPHGDVSDEGKGGEGKHKGFGPGGEGSPNGKGDQGVQGQGGLSSGPHEEDDDKGNDKDQKKQKNKKKNQDHDQDESPEGSVPPAPSGGSDQGGQGAGPSGAGDSDGNGGDKGKQKHKGPVVEPSDGSGPQGPGDSGQGEGGQGPPSGAFGGGSQGSGDSVGNGHGNGKKKGVGPGDQGDQDVQGGQGGQSTSPQGGDQGGQGNHDGNGNKDKKNKKDKCRENPDQPDCQN